MSDDHMFSQAHKPQFLNSYFPLRRGFSRLFDLEMLSLVWTFIQVRVLCISPSSLAGILLTLLFTALMLLMTEPFLLYFLGYTPGKAIFGIHISDNSGNRLPFSASLSRTWKMFVYGLGLRIFPFSLLALIINIIKKIKGKTLFWEHDSSLRIKDDKKIRWLLFILLFLLILFARIYLSLQGPMLNGSSDGSIRGFSTSYNRLLKYNSISAYHLDPEGDVIIDQDLSQYVYDVTAMRRDIGYEIQNDKLTAVTAVYRPTQLAGIIPDMVKERMVLIKAMNAGLDSDERLNEIQLLSIQNTLTSQPFASFTMTTDDVSIKCQVMSYGYHLEEDADSAIHVGNMLYPDEDTDSSFEMNFSITYMEGNH